MVHLQVELRGKNKEHIAYPIMASNKKMVSTTSSVEVTIFCGNFVCIVLQKLTEICSIMRVTYIKGVF